MDKLEQLYNLYVSKGLITDKTSIDVFRGAKKDQVQKLYDLGKSEGLFETTDVETFSSAWVVPKKEQAVSTESPLDSAQEPSSSGMLEGQETQAVDSESSSVKTDLLEQEPNEDIAALYDKYKQEGKITPAQTKEIRTKVESQKKGDRSIWEDVDAYASGLLATGYAVPMYKYDSEKELTEKRIQKNKVDFLSELPEEKVKELNDYAVNRSVELNRQDTNILAENSILEEKARLLVKNLNHQKEGIDKILDLGKNVPAEGIEAYEELYKELESIGLKYNENVDIIESDQEDIGDFYEELDLLKRNYGGLDYYKDVTRLSTADMIAGVMEFGISTAEMVSPTGVPMPNIEGHQFVKEFREEVSKQRELLRPQLAVGDIESASDFGKWLAEQTATQLPIITVLAASGGSTGLTLLGASAGGQKMGELRDEQSKEAEEYIQKVSDINTGDYSKEEKDLAISLLKPAVPEYNPLEIYLAGTAFGMAEALSERVSLGILSKGKRALTAINRSGLTTEVKKGVGEYSKDFIFNGLKEGSSEVGNQWVQNLVDMVYLDKKDVHIFDGTEDALASGFAMGVGMTAVPTLVGLGGKAFMDKTVRRRIIANTNKIEGYMSELKNNPDISDEAKAFLEKKVKQVTKETQQDLVDTLGKLPEIGEQGIKDLIKLDKKANGILQLVKEVEKTDLSDEVKNELKLDYKKQVDKILEDKESILNPKKEDGTEQEAQQEPKEVAEPKEAKPKVTTKDKGTDKRAKGADKVQGKDGKKPSVVGDGKGVQQDSARDKGDAQLIEDLKDKEFEVQEKRAEMTERVQNGETAAMSKDEYKKFRDEQNALRVEERSIAKQIKDLEKGVKKVKPQATVEGATKYKNKTSDVLQKEVIEEYGSKKFSEAIRELGIETVVDKAGKETVKLNREQLETVAENLGYAEEVTIKDVKKIDLSDKAGLNQAIEFLDNLDKGLSEFGKETLGMAIPVVVLQGAVKVMKAAVKTAKTGADILSAGLEYIKTTDWFKKLSDEDKKKATKEVMQQLVDVLNPKKSEGRLGIEEELDRQLNAGKTEREAIAQFETQKERMIAEDILKRRKPVNQKEAYKKANESYDKAKEEMVAKKSTITFLSKGLRKIAKLYWDRQYLPKMLLMKAGGKLIRNYMITSKGASGFARYNWDKAYNKIYKGLSTKQIETLDKVILQMRFIAIDENREARGEDPVVHPDFQNKQTSQAYLDELKEQIGEKEFNNLTKRANDYFDTFKELLDSMYESGIINKEFRDSFFDVNYQPRVFLKFLTDQEQEMSIIEMGAPESASLGAKQIQRLEDGSSESLIVDSMYLLGRSLNTRAKSNAINITTRKFSEFMKEQAEKIAELKKKDNPTRKEKRTIRYFEELSSRVRENPIVGFTKSGVPKYKFKKKGLEKAQTYYKDGVKHQLLMEESFFEQYNDNLKGFINNSDKREKIATLSMSALVKTIATGNNPAFFITNSPRDFMFISTFSEEYGSLIPVNMVKVAMDTQKAIKDMRKDRPAFQEFVKHGGMLDFLHTQGKFKGTTAIRQMINNTVDNRVQEKGKTVFSWITFAKLQMYSEIGFRMGVFNRSIKNQLKELGLKNIEDATKEQQEDVYTNAAASARNTTDFSQGGIYTKDADALVPYLNAGVQGTRVAIENLHERPVETMVRMAQSAVILSAVPIAGSLYMLGAGDREEGEEDYSPTELYLKALEGVSQYDKVNYQIVFTGKRTDDGEFEFVRLSKPHFLTPLVAYVNGVQEEVMKKNVGWVSKDKTIENVKFALEKNISPIELSVSGNVTRNPIIKASLTYMTGYDFYRNQDLSYLRGKVPVPVEGHESKAVEGFYKTVGEDFLVSPARMKGAVESMITTPSTSPFVGVLYGGLDVALSDKESAESMADIKKSILKSVTGRFHKSTSEFNRREDYDKLFIKEFSKVEIKNLKNKFIFKDLAKKVVNKETTNEEINNEFKRMAGDDVFEFERLVKTFEETIKNPHKNPIILDLQFRKPYQRALILAEIFGDNLLEEKKEIGKMNKQLKNDLFSNNIMNDETIIRYLELVKKK